MAGGDFSEIRTTASSRNFHNTHNGVKTMAIIERTHGKETNVVIDEVLISSDSHVIEPEGLWKKQLPKAFQDRAPGFGGHAVGGRILSWWSAENCMWSNDFPHGNSTWPHSRQVVARDVVDLPAVLRAKLVREDVARLYDIPVPSPV
jgi:hypothetical protein